MQTTGTLNVERMRDLLTTDGVLVFAGRESVGADHIYAQLSAMPSGMTEMAFTLVPTTSRDTILVRATGPNGAPLPSPGGPMSAMDFLFTLEDDYRIRKIEPRPHHTEPRDLAPALRPGDVAPNFALPAVNGQVEQLAAESHAATVVVFTCNPCPWALGWHDRIQQVGRDYAERDVRIVHINANDPTLSPKDSLEASKNRVSQGDFEGPYLIDHGQLVARAWGARHTPDIFVIDQSGTVIYHGAPDASVDQEDLNADWLRAGIDAALNGTIPTLADTEPVGCTIKWTMK